MNFKIINILIFGILFVITIVEGKSLPGSRLWSSSWKETKDSNEYLWLHGGVGYGEQQGQGRGSLSDLWSFDIEKKSWNYKSSYSGINQEPSYQSPYRPGSSFATSIWKIEDKLYNYNTNIINLKSSLWKYVNDEWLLIHGPHKNIEYGEKGVPNFSNNPGNRFLSAHWKDDQDNMYLFGGIKGDDSIFLFDYNYTYNDLWVFNEKLGWSWIHGEKSPNSKGIYGYKGLPSKNTVPPARYECSFASNSTHAVVFGGLTSYSSGTLCLNDLWLFNIGKNEWTWIGGDQIGILSNDDAPSPRTGSMLWWDNDNDAIYIYGGVVYIDSISVQKGDMWKFDMKTYLWTKIFDDPDEGSSNSFNESYPGFLSRGSTWTDSEGNLWLFGGNADINLSGDLWSFDTEELKWSFVAGFKKHDQSSIIKKKFSANPIIITLSLCLILVFVVLIVSLIISIRSRKKSQITEENEKLLIQRIRDEEDFDPYSSHASLTSITSINSFSIQSKDLNKQEKIKRGKSGPIWFGTYQKSAVAIHEIPDVTREEYEKIKKHVSSLSNTSMCDNVVKVYGSLFNEETIYVIEEWVGEPLSKCYIGKTCGELFALLKGISFGMSYLHSEKVNRRVLSPHNIFVSSDGTPKIRYFSYFDILLNEKKDSDFLISETVRYMSPESILDQNFSESSDVWSFGILVYELFSGKIPFEEVKNPIVLSIKISNEYLTPKLPKDMPEWLSDIVLQCWDPNPAYRPAFSQLYNVIEMNTNK